VGTAGEEMTQVLCAIWIIKKLKSKILKKTASSWKKKKGR
jgi:hypothetical protein